MVHVYPSGEVIFLNDHTCFQVLTLDYAVEYATKLSWKCSATQPIQGANSCRWKNANRRTMGEGCFWLSISIGFGFISLHWEWGWYLHTLWAAIFVVILWLTGASLTLKSSVLLPLLGTGNAITLHDGCALVVFSWHATKIFMLLQLNCKWIKLYHWRCTGDLEVRSCVVVCSD